MKNKFGHKLSKLWAEAATLGLPIGAMPQWAETLNGLHEYPFHLRYPTKVNALVLPDVQQTETALRNLIYTVRKGIDSL